jgi:hypothetical protein
MRSYAVEILGKWLCPTHTHTHTHTSLTTNYFLLQHNEVITYSACLPQEHQRYSSLSRRSLRAFFNHASLLLIQFPAISRSFYQLVAATLHHLHTNKTNNHDRCQTSSFCCNASFPPSSKTSKMEKATDIPAGSSHSAKSWCDRPKTLKIRVFVHTTLHKVGTSLFPQFQVTQHVTFGSFEINHHSC